MNAWWQMWKSSLPKELCDQIVEDGLQLPLSIGTIGHGGITKIDNDFRSSNVRWIPWSWAWLRRELEYYFLEANIRAFGFDLLGLREVQFTEYIKPNDHYEWHEDLTWAGNLPYHRKLSMVIQLSDPATYDGCDLELEREPPNKEDLRQRGTVIIFPSFHKHRVTNITKGTRYSLVAWYDGPKFR